MLLFEEQLGSTVVGAEPRGSTLCGCELSEYFGNFGFAGAVELLTEHLLTSFLTDGDHRWVFQFPFD